MQKIQTLNQNVADLTQTLDFAIHNATKSSTLLQRQIFSQKMLETLINDLLDLAKLENNKFNFDMDFFNLSDTIYKALDMLSFSAKQLGVKLKAQIDS